MKIKVVSDLHLEFGDVNIKNDENCDVLILSGDILVAEDLYDYPSPDPYTPGGMASFGRRVQASARYNDFFKRVSFQFPHVIYVAGNHELYHGKWVKSINYLREFFAQRFSNVYFLERDMKTIGDVTFIGSTLWTDMNKHDPITLHAVRDMMNDYRLIRNDDKGYTALKPADTVIRHRESLGYIKTIVEGMHDEKFVVVGHHSPSFQSVHEQYKSQYLMNGAYHSSLEEFIIDHPQIKLWTHGHTHHVFDYMIGGTRVVCNPRGYCNADYVEETGFNPNMFIEI
jgi:Icc-related predicted phosphoesterase